MTAVNTERKELNNKQYKCLLNHRKNKNKNSLKFQKDIATLCIFVSLRPYHLELCMITHVILLLLLRRYEYLVVDPYTHVGRQCLALPQLCSTSIASRSMTTILHLRLKHPEPFRGLKLQPHPPDAIATPSASRVEVFGFYIMTDHDPEILDSNAILTTFSP